MAFYDSSLYFFFGNGYFNDLYIAFLGLLVITTEQQYFYDVYTESTVNFELNVTSDLPVLWVSWEKSVVSYFYNLSTVNITDDRIFGGTIDDPSLTISNISLADTGHYRFTATNAGGSRSVVFYLSVNLRKWDRFRFLRKACTFEYYS